MEKTYTDEEISALENLSGGPKILTDEQVAAMEKNDQINAEHNKYNDLLSAAAAAGDVLSAGYGPNILAGIKKGSFSSPEYIQERDRLNKELNNMKIEDEGAFAAGQGAGVLATSLLPTGAVSKGGTLLSRLGKAALAGGLIGAATDTPDPLNRVADPFSSEDLIERGKNAAFGAVSAPAAIVTGSALNKVIPNSTNRAFSAMQPDKTARAEARMAGVRSIGKSEEQINRLPTKDNLIKFAKEEGILEGLPDIQTIYTRANDAKMRYGKELSDVYSRAQSVADNLMHEKGFDPKNMKYQLGLKDIDQLKKKIINSIQNEDWADPDRKKAIKQITNYFDGIKEDVSKAPDLLQLHEIKSQIGNKAYKASMAKTPSNTEVFWRKTGREIDDEIKKRIEGLSEIVGKSSDKELPNQLKDLNRKFSFSSKINDIAANAYDSSPDNMPRELFNIIPKAFNSPGVQMGLSNLGSAIETLPNINPKGVAAGLTMAQQKRARPASESELLIPNMQILPLTPQQQEAEIKNHPNLKASEKAKLRNEIRKGSR